MITNNPKGATKGPSIRDVRKGEWGSSKADACERERRGKNGQFEENILKKMFT